MEKASKVGAEWRVAAPVNRWPRKKTVHGTENMKITLLSGVKGFLQRMGNQEVEADANTFEKSCI